MIKNLLSASFALLIATGVFADDLTSKIDFRPQAEDCTVWGSYATTDGEVVAALRLGTGTNDENYFSVTTAPGMSWNGGFAPLSMGNEIVITAIDDIKSIRLYANGYGSTTVNASHISATDGTNELNASNKGYKASSYGFGSTEQGYSEWTPLTATKQVSFTVTTSANVQVIEVVTGDFNSGSGSDIALEGKGTASSPYIITAANQLQYMNGSKAHFALANDIDLNNEEWTPIHGFVGVLDGQNHTISNITIEGKNRGWDDLSSTDIAFFSVVGDFSASTPTAFRNLNIDGVTITLKAEYNHNIGVLCADARGTEIDNVNISNVKVRSTFVKKSEFTLYFPRFGAIAAEASNGTTITNCTVKGIDFADYGASEVGSLVGTLKLDSYIKNCSAEGSLTAGGSLGGIVGTIGSGQNANVLNSNSNVTLHGYSSVGGIVGALLGGTVAKCVSQGDIYAYNSAGGITGYIDTGEGYNADITNCVSLTKMHYAGEGNYPTNVTIHAIAGWTTEDSPLLAEPDAKHSPQGVTNCYATEQFMSKSDIDVSKIYISLDKYYPAHEGTLVSVSDLTTEFLSELGIDLDIATGISSITAAKPACLNGKAFSISGQQTGKVSKGIIIMNGKKFVKN